MNDFCLTQKEISELKKLHRSLRDKRMADRVKAVIALAKGWSAAQVAEILLIDEKTSRHYFRVYKESGSDALLTNNYQGLESKLYDWQIRELVAHLEENVYTDSKAIIAYIKKRYAVSYSTSGMVDLLHRIGFSYKKPKHAPGKQDPEKQREFLARYEAIMAQKAPEDPVYFADATHPQHNSVPSYGWIKKGAEKELKANCGRQRLNINGAIDIETLEPVTGFYDTINADATIALFKKIELKHRAATVIYIIVDNARYYRSRLLREYVSKTKIELVFLPPYSPNLNLIERYWKFFKKKVTNNSYYETFQEFKQACRDFFRKRRKYYPELQTLLTENFHIAPT